MMRDICAAKDDAQPHSFRPGEPLCTFCYAPGGQTKLELWVAGTRAFQPTTKTKGGQE